MRVSQDGREEGIVEQYVVAPSKVRFLEVIGNKNLVELSSLFCLG
jgi:hypothetical protein